MERLHADTVYGGTDQSKCALQTANDPKLSDRGVRRGTCMVGGKAAAEAGAVTHGAVRCSAWLGVAVICEERCVVYPMG